MRRRKRSCSWIEGSAVLALSLAGCNAHVDLGPVADAAGRDAIRESFTAGKAAAGPEKVARVIGTGWATLRGQFVYDGEPPAMKPYSVTKETDICSINGKPPLQETLLVDPGTKGIKNVVIFLRDASRVHESAAPKTNTVEFDQKHCVFLTHVVGVTVGQTLDIKNSDSTGHNTNLVGTGFNPTIPAGGTVPFKVQKETSFPNEVKCGIHPWMTAYMLTRKDGYFAVTDAQGHFELPNVPAGEPLVFQVWHESGAAAGNGLVGTTPDATDIKWTNRGRISVMLPPDAKKEVKVVVPAKAFRG